MPNARKACTYIRCDLQAVSFRLIFLGMTLKQGTSVHMSWTKKTSILHMGRATCGILYNNPTAHYGNHVIMLNNDNRTKKKHYWLCLSNVINNWAEHSRNSTLSSTCYKLQCRSKYKTYLETLNTVQYFSIYHIYYLAIITCSNQWDMADQSTT